jgi:hypothetical protein
LRGAIGGQRDAAQNPNMLEENHEQYLTINLYDTIDTPYRCDRPRCRIPSARGIERGANFPQFP